jgi:hypothetical protein
VLTACRPNGFLVCCGRLWRFRLVCLKEIIYEIVMSFGPMVGMFNLKSISYYTLMISDIADLFPWLSGESNALPKFLIRKYNKVCWP